MAKKDSAGTEVRVFTYTHSEDAVVPDGWDIVTIDHDRQMAVTRVTATRPYDAKRSQEEKDAAAGGPATPSYPQTAGAAPAPAEPPVTSFAWGSIDTSKVQNQETVAQLPASIAAQEAATAQAPAPEALVDEVKANDSSTDDKSNADAQAEGGEDKSETLEKAAEIAENKADSASS